MNKKRPHKVTFRLSEPEWTALKSRMHESGLNDQQYLIRAVMNKKMIDKESLHNLMIELRREGVNLNQIARSCNSGNTELEKERINASLINLEVLWQFLR